MSFPTSIDEITPEWLTDALKSTDAIRDSTVKSFETTILGEGAGFIGQLARLTLSYDQPETGSPSALVAKAPALAPENRQLGDLFRFYERECRFYEDLATRVELRTPRCYYIGMDTQRGDFLLLLEDLAPAQVGDQLKGCSSAEVELALRDLATVDLNSELVREVFTDLRIKYVVVNLVTFEGDPTVIATEGLRGATLRRVAAEAGCTTGALTHYFADRQALLTAALQAAQRQTGN